MAADASAYRTLGLDPGADAAQVEAAYRKLIKRYHPDLAGGDAARAAEINWAFDHIRKGQGRPVQRMPAPRRPSYPAVRPQPPRPRRRALHLVPLALAMVALASLLEPRSIGEALDGVTAPLTDAPVATGWYRTADAAANPAEIADAPLDSDGIDRSVVSAMRIASEGGLDRLTNQSRRCHAELRESPGLARLDQCVAFDEAAVVLMQRDPMDSGGQFGAAAVTARQLGAARLLSDDFLAIESRLGQIRSRVEFALAPPDPKPQQAQRSRAY